LSEYCRIVGILSDTVGLYCRTVGPGLKAALGLFEEYSCTSCKLCPPILSDPLSATPSGPPPTPPSRPVPARPDRPEPSRTVPYRPEPSRAVPSRPEPSRAVPSRSRAVPSRPAPSHPVPSRPEPSRAVPAALTKPSARTLDPARCPVCQMCLDISYCPSPHPSPTSPWVHNASDLPWCPRRSVREVPKCSLELKVMWAQKGW
jgi:hypothetical protein